MMAKYKEIDLGLEGFEYVKECLQSGKTLSGFLIHRIQESQGAVTTFLPSHVTESAAKEFHFGGKAIVLPNDGSVFSKEAVEVKTRFNAVEQLSSVISKFLVKNDQCLCIFEDALASTGDPFLLSTDNRFASYGDEVYYILCNEDAARLDKIVKTIRQANSWLCIGAMASLPANCESILKSGKLSRRDLEVIAKGTQKIIVGAYDGEGFLIWLE
jgi:hypothetical protein